MANKKECDRCGHLGPVEAMSWSVVTVLGDDIGIGRRCDEKDLCVGCTESFWKWLHETNKAP